MLLSHAVARVMTLLPCCCHGICFGFGVLFLFLFPYNRSVIAVVLPCWLVVSGVGDAEQAHFDLYMTSALVGHHAPLQPLVTGPHLHPSPASSPPSSSSPSTLPSSSQSSVTGPPPFSFSYLFSPHDFSLSQGESAVCKCFHFILSLWFTRLCSLVWFVCSESASFFSCYFHLHIPKKCPSLKYCASLKIHNY